MTLFSIEKQVQCRKRKGNCTIIIQFRRNISYNQYGELKSPFEDLHSARSKFRVVGTE